MNSVSIEFAMLDFSNPDAVKWMKLIMLENLIKEGKAYGWMLDFGEYTPFDTQTFGNDDAASFHNAYPYEWAKLNREV